MCPKKKTSGELVMEIAEVLLDEAKKNSNMGPDLSVSLCQLSQFEFYLVAIL